MIHHNHLVNKMQLCVSQNLMNSEILITLLYKNEDQWSLE